jgi:hypothetical protein
MVQIDFLNAMHKKENNIPFQALHINMINYFYCAQHSISMTPSLVLKACYKYEKHVVTDYQMERLGDFLSGMATR